MGWGGGGGGVNTYAYKCVQGGRGDLNMTKNLHFVHRFIENVPKYLKHLRIDNGGFHVISLRITF